MSRTAERRADVVLLMRSCCLYLVLLRAAVASSGCSSAEDCSLGGECRAGRCACYPTWEGPNCTILNLLPARALNTSGLPAAWARPGEQSSWGGRPVVNETTGRWHLYAADMTRKCGLHAWTENSAISHTSADSAAGPYMLVEEQPIFPVFSHNPTAHRAPDGTFLIYHIGSGKPRTTTPPFNCSNGTTPPREEVVPRAVEAGSSPARPPPHVGDIMSPNILAASSAAGPWEPYVQGGGCANPAPYFFPNGTVLLVCSLRNNGSHFGVAVAPSWKGPYHWKAITQIFGEDAFVWRQPVDGSFHMLYHTTVYPVRGICSTAWSRDGLHWKPAFATTVNTTVGETYASFGKEFRLAAGGSFVASRRERHQLVMDSAGWPSLLLNGAAAPAFGRDFTFTSAQPINTH